MQLEIINRAIENLETIKSLEGVYGGDVHNEMYNVSEEYIYTQDGEQVLQEIGTFKAIGLVVDYDYELFGELSTNLTDPCKVANKVHYIIGEYLLRPIYELGLDGGRLSEEDTTAVYNAVMAAIDGKFHHEIWDEVVAMYKA